MPRSTDDGGLPGLDGDDELQEADYQPGEAGSESIAEASRDVIYIVDARHRVCYANPRAAEVFEMTPRELRGLCWKDLVSDECYDFYKDMFEKVFLTGKPERFETGAALGGEDCWEDTSLVPLRRPHDGNVRAVLGVTRDISERKGLEAALRIACDTIQIGIYLRQEGRIVYANLFMFMSRCLGYSAAELGAMSMLEIIHPDYRRKYRECSKRMLRGESDHPYEYRVVTRSGLEKWLLESAVPFFRQGRPAVLGSVSDITRQKEVEKVLVQMVRGRGEGLLLVNDDPVNGDIVRDILEALGYRALLAASPREALEVFAGDVAGIDAVVIDNLKSGASELIESLRRSSRRAIIVLAGEVINGGRVSPNRSRSSIEFLAARIRIALDARSRI